jgi:hypothetical protein
MRFASETIAFPSTRAFGAGYLLGRAGSECLGETM